MNESERLRMVGKTQDDADHMRLRAAEARALAVSAQAAGEWVRAAAMWERAAACETSAADSLHVAWLLLCDEFHVAYVRGYGGLVEVTIRTADSEPMNRAVAGGEIGRVRYRVRLADGTPRPGWRRNAVRALRRFLPARTRLVVSAKLRHGAVEALAYPS